MVCAVRAIPCWMRLGEQLNLSYRMFRLGHRALSTSSRAHSGAKRTKARSRWRPVGRAAATHRVKRRPHRPAPIRDARRHPGTQMRRPRAGARRCTRASPVRSDRMWSLPISPAAAIIYESIHSGALNGRVDSWSACWSGARAGRVVPARLRPCTLT